MKRNGIREIAASIFLDSANLHRGYLLLVVNVNAPYFHNGSAQTLEEVFDQHGFGAGTIGNTLNTGDQTNLLSLLKSIDGRTALFQSDGDIFNDPNPARNLP
jgi:hypothetical protein